MKIRNSFVANSSSSSFIIGLDRMPTDAIDAAEVYFGDKKGFVGSAITDYMYSSFRQIPIDFNKMFGLLESKSISEFENYDYDDTRPFEEQILDEFLSQYTYKAKNDFKGYWSSAEKTRYEIFEENELHKWVLSMGFEDYADMELSKTVSWGEIWEKKKHIEDDWFKLPENAEALKAALQKFVDKFKDYPVIMQAEFSDDSILGGECEHGDHWAYITNHRFSHH